MQHSEKNGIGFESSAISLPPSSPTFSVEGLLRITKASFGYELELLSERALPAFSGSQEQDLDVYEKR